MKKTVFCCLILVLSTILGGGSNLASTAPFSLSIASEPRSVKSGSPVHVKIKLTNISTSDIQFFVRNTECDYSVEVKDANGAEVPDTQHKRDVTCDLSGGNALVQLKPRESREFGIDVSHLKEMVQPGKYSVKVMRKIPKLTSDTVESNTLEITVTDNASK